MKKKAQLEKDLPHIGNIARGLMKEKRITHRKLGRLVGWHTTTVTMMLKRRNWSVAELLTVGKVLGTDLFKYFYPVPPVALVPITDLEAARNEVAALKNEMKTKDDELLKLRTENTLMREMMKRD